MRKKEVRDNRRRGADAEVERWVRVSSNNEQKQNGEWLKWVNGGSKKRNMAECDNPK